MNLPKVYEPAQYESDIYALWEKSGTFAPKHRGSKESFSIVLPPPNANGDLHVGHSLMFAIQDVVVRYQRMRGKAVLWVPGADHAGFETQAVYEKRLAQEGKSRFDFTRDELYARVWDFVGENRDNYQQQFRRLGASVDWDRHVYTLDEKVVARAYKTFKQLWDDGLVYRGERLVNFCTFHGTGFADIEVEYKDEESHLWHITYPLTDGSGALVVATTRPETMLGDVAVAVHPDDERYKTYVGKTVRLPLTERDIPVIADDFVDTSFGTGAVKITPAHDPTDYEVAQRHDLPLITVIDTEGKLVHTVPESYRGKSVLEAREAIVHDLKQNNILDREEPYTHSVGHCYKCGTVIQPLLREQWFVDMKPLATKAISALRSDAITFYPSTKKEQLITYLQGLRDWNISRQIAWGIPIPAFQSLDNPEHWIYDDQVDQEIITVDGVQYRRDADVLDTWFSSSSWPYATLEYPDNKELAPFYPNSLMETGGEILYPWVSRMIMLGLYVTGEIPFKDVYIHGYVLAEDGSKMSKSVGNVVSPITVADAYGSDALRLGLLAGRAPGVNRGYDPRKVEAGRNFCNKLWNIARFVEAKVGDDFKRTDRPKPTSSADAWILYRLQQTVTTVGSLLDEYRFSEAADAVYHYVWDELADWYLEASKSHLNTDVLAYVFEQTLKLAHPFAPFVTETIWQTLQWEADSLLAVSHWPKPIQTDEQAAAAFEELRDIVSEIRFIRGVLHLRTGINLYHKGDELLEHESGLIAALSQLESIQKVRDGYGLHLTSTERQCWLDLDEESTQNFISQLAAKQVQQQKVAAQLQARLANKAYVANAPKAVVAETKAQLEVAEALLAKVSDEYARFNTQAS